MSKNAPNKNKSENSEKADKSIHDGHRDRMREKFRKNGFKNMEEHEILEMILYYSVPRKNTNEIAHKLINRFGSLSGVLEATEEQIACVDGVSKNSAFLLSILIPVFNVYSKQVGDRVRLTSSEETGEFMRMQMVGKQKECVVLLCLTNGGKVLHAEEICDGDAGNVVVNVRKIVETVLKFPTTGAVVLAHNHPGGIALPSRDDIAATKELKKMLGAMDINFVDHIITTDDDYVSMADSDGFASIFK